MNEARLLTILKSPHVSEKGTTASGLFIFKVAKDACKPEIKQAVELTFNVAVKEVRTCNMKGKVRKFGRTFGRQKAWKKAYVTLEPGQEIEIAS